MNGFRKHILARLFAVFTALLLLNTSFFLEELSLLGISNDQLVQNIAKILSNGIEEERDGESAPTDPNAKEIDLHHHNLHVHELALYIIDMRYHCDGDDFYPHANYSLTFSPPPDALSLS